MNSCHTFIDKSHVAVQRKHEQVVGRNRFFVGFKFMKQALSNNALYSIDFKRVFVFLYFHTRTRTIFDLVKPPRDVYGLASKFKYSQIKVRMRRSNRSQRPYNLRVYASASKHHSAPMCFHTHVLFELIFI